MSDDGKLFVGGLSFDTTEDVLEETFSKYGTISKADVIRDRDTGMSRGFGFVTFENPEDAKDALANLHGSDLDGRTIRVDEAGKSKSGGSRGRGGGSYQQRGSRGGYGGGDRYGGGERSYSDRGYGGGYGGGGYSRGGGGGGSGRYSGGGGGGGYYRDRQQGSGGSYRDGYTEKDA